MTVFTTRASFAALLVAILFAVPASAALYDNGKDIKSGDIADQDYWWAKFDMMMLDIAVKTKQPEGKIAVNLATTLRRLDDLIKKYPNHEDLKKWKEHAEEINKKIDQNADRGASFQSNCPWDEANFAQLWVNFNTAKMLLADKQWDKAYGLLQNVNQNYEFMLRPDRMKNYPEELSKWVTDHKEEADKMTAEAKSKK